MRKLWQLVHHIIAHPLIGLSNGRLWAWRFHDWTIPKAWHFEEQEPFVAPETLVGTGVAR